LQALQECSLRKGGSDGQRDSARRARIEKAGSIYAGHEKYYDGETRIDVKTGAQIRPMITAFDKHKAQREASRPLGDVRPFVLHVRPSPNGKRQLTTFESNSDSEYRQPLYAMCLQGWVDGAVTETDERERDNFHRRPPMSKQEKLELIREMRAQLMSGERHPLT
jgi:hypothetical protein